MSIYLLEPMDTQFHRSTLPFDAEADGHTMTQPLPWPRTVYGALRALGFSRQGVSPAMRNSSESNPIWGNWEELGDVFIKGPFVFHKRPTSVQMLLPMPADVVALKDGEDLYHAVPQKDCPLDSCTDCTGFPGVGVLDVLGRTSGSKVETIEEERFLTTGELPAGTILKAYLTQDLAGSKKTRFRPPQDEVFTIEPRVGIKRVHQSHVAEQGWLYSAHHYRLLTWPNKDEFGYWVQIERENGSSPDLPERGMIRLGGESRPVKYRLLENNTPLANWASSFQDSVIEQIKLAGCFKLFLITPWLFPDGKTHPFKKISNGIFMGIPGGKKAQLVGVAIQKRILLGGWNIQKEYPKPLETGVPPGSVYFLRVEDWPQSENQRTDLAKQLFNELNFKSLCSGNLEKEGFGITIVGGWHV